MQRTLLVLNVILLAAVGYLYFQVFGKPVPYKIVDTRLSHDQSKDYEGRIAFVNIDTLDLKYQYIIDEYERLEKEQKRNQRKLENKLMSAETEYQQLQKDAPYMTQEQAGAAQNRLETLSIQIQDMEQRMAGDLRDLQTNANETYRNNLMSYLEDYNKERNFDYILGFSAIGSILWAKDTFDITKPVLDHLNTEYSKMLEESETEE